MRVMGNATRRKFDDAFDDTKVNKLMRIHSSKDFVFWYQKTLRIKCNGM